MAKRSSEKEILEGKIFAVLSYLSILCILPLLLRKENDFVLSHGRQGLVIFIGEVGVFIIHIVLGPWILSLGTFFFGIISLWGIFKALQGHYVKLPFVFEIAEKITL